MQSDLWLRFWGKGSCSRSHQWQSDSLNQYSTALAARLSSGNGYFASLLNASLDSLIKKIDLHYVNHVHHYLYLLLMGWSLITVNDHLSSCAFLVNNYEINFNSWNAQNTPCCMFVCAPGQLLWKRNLHKVRGMHTRVKPITVLTILLCKMPNCASHSDFL